MVAGTCVWCQLSFQDGGQETTTVPCSQGSSREASNQACTGNCIDQMVPSSQRKMKRRAYSQEACLTIGRHENARGAQKKSKRIANRFGPTRPPGIQRFIDSLLSHRPSCGARRGCRRCGEPALGRKVCEMKSRELQQDTVMDAVVGPLTPRTT